MNSQKKILLVVQDFPVISETFIAKKFETLNAKGWDVEVACQKFNASLLTDFPGLFAYQNKIHKGWPLGRKGPMITLYFFALFHCFLRHPWETILYWVRGLRLLGGKVFKQFYADAHLIGLNPDILHFEFGTLAASRMYLKKIFNCKTIVSFRGFDLNFAGLEQPNYYEEVWKNIDTIHCLGEDLWRRAISRGCPPKKPHRLISPAIDTNFFSPSQKSGSNLKDRPVRILSVGRLEWKKGYEFALHAVSLLKKQGHDFEYHIVGAGQALESLAFHRHQLGLEKEVKFIGSLSHEAIKGALEWADLFLHTAVSEGFCNAVLEAQAMRLPVVCTDADGLSENVKNGVTGFVVSRRSAELLAEKISCLIQNHSLREVMGQAGRQRVQSYYRSEDQIRKFEDLYIAVS